MLPNKRDTPDIVQMKQLSSKILSHPLKGCMTQYLIREDYKCYLESHDSHNMTYLVRKHAYSRSSDELSSNPIPSHVMTRRVNVSSSSEQGNNINIVTCDCGYYNRHGHPCRHIYCITETIPNESHFHPECLKTCYRNMHRNETCTKIVEHNWDLFTKHNGMMIPSQDKTMQAIINYMNQI